MQNAVMRFRPLVVLPRPIAVIEDVLHATPERHQIMPDEKRRLQRFTAGDRPLVVGEPEKISLQIAVETKERRNRSLKFPLRLRINQWNHPVIAPAIGVADETDAVHLTDFKVGELRRRNNLPQQLRRSRTGPEGKPVNPSSR